MDFVNRISWPLRIVVGSVLFVVASFFLIVVSEAHVTMCMIGAIGYSVGLLMPSKKWAPIISSFFFSWVLFYTVYTASTFLAVMMFGFSPFPFNGEIPDVALDMAWLYHTGINFALLILFFLKMDRMRSVIHGFWSAMVAAPLMFLMVPFGRGIWLGIEGPFVIWTYFAIGIIILLLHVFGQRQGERYEKVLFGVRRFIIFSLWVYVVITLIPFVLGT